MYNKEGSWLDATPFCLKTAGCSREDSRLVPAYSRRSSSHQCDKKGGGGVSLIHMLMYGLYTSVRPMVNSQEAFEIKLNSFAVDSWQIFCAMDSLLKEWVAQGVLVCCFKTINQELSTHIYL